MFLLHFVLNHNSRCKKIHRLFRLQLCTHIKFQDRVVSGARLLTGGVSVCVIAHRRSVAVLLYAV